jgi:small ligand-binding sensory domain FIST
MSERTRSGYLFGGLASAHAGAAIHIANGVFEGGLSGVAFAPQLNLISRVTQGCQPVGPARRITAAEGNVVLALDEAPALDVLVADTGVNLARPQQTLSRLRETLVGLNEGDEDTMARAGAFGIDTRVRHLVGLDPGRHAIAIGENVRAGMQLAFCTRNPEAARRDLVRICSEIREELEPETEPLAAGLGAMESGAQRIAGAVYVSCAGRGGPHFGAPSAELQIVRRALGDVPLVGFFAGGEIARHHLYGYTGVLTVFCAD